MLREKSLSPEKPAIQAARTPKTHCFACFSPDCHPLEEGYSDLCEVGREQMPSPPFPKQLFPQRPRDTDTCCYSYGFKLFPAPPNNNVLASYYRSSFIPPSVCSLCFRNRAPLYPDAPHVSGVESTTRAVMTPDPI